mmetsp:Transcript_54514/g.140324  ORF Transcript_54514/g.140324 Transcript_54514/m.140324 type:complete len:294 (-) Transcript_54514:1154-2035(-)
MHVPVQNHAQPRLCVLLLVGAGLAVRPVELFYGCSIVPLPLLAGAVPLAAQPDGVRRPLLRQLAGSLRRVDGNLQRLLLGDGFRRGEAAELPARVVRLGCLVETNEDVLAVRRLDIAAAAAAASTPGVSRRLDPGLAARAVPEAVTEDAALPGCVATQAAGAVATEGVHEHDGAVGLGVAKGLCILPRHELALANTIAAIRAHLEWVVGELAWLLLIHDTLVPGTRSNRSLLRRTPCGARRLRDGRRLRGGSRGSAAVMHLAVHARAAVAQLALARRVRAACVHAQRAGVGRA